MEFFGNNQPSLLDDENSGLLIGSTMNKHGSFRTVKMVNYFFVELIIDCADIHRLILLENSLEGKIYENNFQEHDYLRYLKIPPFFPRA